MLYQLENTSESALPDMTNMSTLDPVGRMYNGTRFPHRSSFDLRQAVIAAYLPTFLFGIAGNGLVIYIIAYYKAVRTKSVANYYIWNLSFADFFFVLTLPFFCYTTYYQDWPFGWFVCKMSLAIRETNRFASVFTLVALSMDRYIASFYNLGHLRTIRAGKIVCVLVWLLCLCTSIPYWLYAHSVSGIHNNRTRTSCAFSWPRTNRVQYVVMWTYLQFFAAYVIPSVLILGSYILLAGRLNKLLKNRLQNSTRIQKPNKKMTRTVLIVVLTFLLCQTPYHVVQFMSLHKVFKAQEYRKQGIPYIPSALEYNTFVILNAIAQILVFVSSCCNPIIYGLLNDNYRKLYSVVLCRCRKQRVLEDTGVSSGDSRQDPESGVTYRLQITFHLPCSKKRLARSRQHQAPPSTEHVELDDKSTNCKLLPETTAAEAEAEAAAEEDAADAMS